MNEGQKAFFNFIMDCTKEECKEKATELLNESFERQNTNRFDLAFLTKFNTTIKDYIRDDKLDEVMAVLSKFGERHLS